MNHPPVHSGKWGSYHGEGSVAVAVAIWHMTYDTLHLTHDKWHMTPNTWYFFFSFFLLNPFYNICYWCYYPHTSRDSVSPVFRICSLSSFHSTPANLSFPTQPTAFFEHVWPYLNRGAGEWLASTSLFTDIFCVFLNTFLQVQLQLTIWTLDSCSCRAWTATGPTLSPGLVLVTPLVNYRCQ